MSNSHQSLSKLGSTIENWIFSLNFHFFSKIFEIFEFLKKNSKISKIFEKNQKFKLKIQFSGQFLGSVLILTSLHFTSLRTRASVLGKSRAEIRLGGQVRLGYLREIKKIEPNIMFFSISQDSKKS